MISIELTHANVTEEQESCESEIVSDFGMDTEPQDAESMEEEAWLEACRKELHEDATDSSETAGNRSGSLGMPHQMSDDGDNLATRSDFPVPSRQQTRQAMMP